MMILLIFRARSQATKLYEKIKSSKVAQLVPTPSALTSGCSLSVKISENIFAIALAQIREQRLNTFLGAFYLDEKGKIAGKIPTGL